MGWLQLGWGGGGGGVLKAVLLGLPADVEAV